MGILDQAGKPADIPIICTITGDAGVGKTRLAATFPRPIFIRSEDGMQSIPIDQRPDALPLISSTDDLWGQLKALIREDHDYRTCVIDSVTKLESLFIQHVVESDEKRPRSINQALGGYGAGLAAVGDLHQRVRQAARLMREQRGMNVVFIAHADTTTIELPDSDPFTRYDLRLGKRSMQPYVDDVDLVGFIKLETFTVGDGERKKARSDGTRLLVTYTTAANISKNRYGITEDLTVPEGENPLAPYVPALQEQDEQAPATTAEEE